MTTLSDSIHTYLIYVYLLIILFHRQARVNHPSIGLKLMNMETERETAIPTGSILVNNPSNVTLIVPADLPEGDYQLVLTTQFAGTGLFPAGEFIPEKRCLAIPK